MMFQFQNFMFIQYSRREGYVYSRQQMILLTKNAFIEIDSSLRIGPLLLLLT